MNKAQTTEYIFGSYVFRAIPNAFNKKIGWWISKAGYAVSYYCFSTLPGDDKEVQRHIACRDAYIKMFENMQAAYERGCATKE